MIEHRVFLDSNILLSFYEISNDDIEKLAEAFALVDQKELVFATTKRVMAEFYRRRSGVIEASLKELDSLRLPQAPTMARALAENAEYEGARKTITMLHKKLLAKARLDAEGKALKADELIKKYFKLARVCEIDADVVEKAKIRVDCGDPPGKRGSLGDAINWEALLALPENRSLSVVSGDNDYRDRLGKGVSDFLKEEWGRQHTGKIELFESLSTCVKALFPEVHISSFEEIDKKIRLLANSGNFATTHASIADLNSVTSFTARQVVELIDILEANNQVGWILHDDDVHHFYRKLSESSKEKLSSAKFDLLQNLLEASMEYRV